MKRMSEVFELPVSNNEVYVSVSLIERSKGKSNIILEHAAHAINHVDALADALDACVKLLAEMPAGEPANESDRAYHQALDALNAYRGTK